MNSPDFLAIGHATRDLVPGGWTLGGGVVFAARTAYALGRRPAILTSGDVRDFLGQIPGLMKVTPATTTTFENIYTVDGRQQTLHVRAAELTAADVPATWRTAPIILLVPLCGEIGTDLADGFPASQVVVCVQGWLRQWDEAGHVSPTPLPPGLSFRSARALTASFEDLGRDEGAVHQLAGRCGIVAVTRGPEGVSLFEQGRETRIPSLPVEERQPTGAGDVFATAFAVRLAETDDPAEAARFGNAAAAISVAGAGPPRREAIAARLAVGR